MADERKNWVTAAMNRGTSSFTKMINYRIGEKRSNVEYV